MEGRSAARVGDTKVFNNLDVIGLSLAYAGYDRAGRIGDRQLTGAPLACSFLLVGRDE